jgi:hypothetical protein
MNEMNDEVTIYGCQLANSGVEGREGRGKREKISANKLKTSY